MKYLTLAGIRSSRVVQGCMRMQSLSAGQLDTLIKTDLDCGITFFDHADIYAGGDCETKFGAFLHENPGIREKIVLQTKCGIRNGMYDFSKEHILASVEGSLKRLQTDYLDFLLLHRPDALCEPEEVAQTFEFLHQSGKVRFFGVSNHNPLQMELLNRYLGSNKIVINQLQFSLTNTTMIDAGIHVNMEDAAAVNRDGSVLDYCRLQGITIQPWSPFQYGFFEGTYIGNPVYSESNRALEQISARYGITSTGLAIAWILRHPAQMQPVIGTVTPERVVQISRAADLVITREEWYELYRAAGKTLP